MISIAIDEEKCIGCRACEIACSHHHKKVFDPEISSIEIHIRGKDMNISAVLHKKGGTNNHLACDRCETETEPLCFKYCDWDAVKMVEQPEEDI